MVSCVVCCANIVSGLIYHVEGVVVCDSCRDKLVDNWGEEYNDFDEIARIRQRRKSAQQGAARDRTSESSDTNNQGGA